MTTSESLTNSNDPNFDDHWVGILSGLESSIRLGAQSDGPMETLGQDASTDQGLRDAYAGLRALSKVAPLFSSGETGVASSQDPSSIARPDRFGRFEIREEIGRGGFGVVFLAHDPVLHRDVALKIPLTEAATSESLRRRFLREAQAAARLTHPNVVQVYEVGQLGPIPFIAASYCRGGSLSQWIGQHPEPMDPKLAARVAKALAEALAYAHRSGVLHRDVKPSNILLEPMSKPYASHAPGLLPFEPKLADFGLARLEDSTVESTASNAVVGSPSYMSPEQARGDVRLIDERSDVYGLGTVLYQMLTRERPFTGESKLEILKQVLEQEPVPPRKLFPAIPRDLDAISLKCLEKDPRRRYASAQELADDLERFLNNSPTQARPISYLGRTARWARRRPMSAVLAALLALIAVAVPSGLAYHSSRLSDALRETEREKAAAVEHRQDAQRRAHASDLRLGFQLLQEGNTKGLDRVLGRYDAESSQDPSPRNFAHRYLMQFRESEPAERTLHSQLVRFAAINTEARMGVSKDKEGDLCGWDPRDGKVRWRMQMKGSGEDYPIAVAMDRAVQSVFAIEKGGNAILVLDPATGQERRRWAQDAMLDGLTASADGKLLAVLPTERRSLQLVDTKSGEVLRTLPIEENKRATGLVVFSNDATQMAATLRGPNGPDTVIAWDISSGKVLIRFDTAAVNSLLAEPESRSFCIIGGYGHYTFNPTVGIIEGSRAVSEIPDRFAAWLGSSLYVNRKRSLGLLFPGEHIGSVASLNWQGANISFLAPSAEGDGLVVGTHNGTVHTLKPPAARLFDAIDWPASDPIVALSHDGSELAISHSGGEITRVDLASGRETRLPSPHRERITSLAYSHDDQLLCSRDIVGLHVVWQNETAVARGRPGGIGITRQPGIAVFNDILDCIVSTGVDEERISLWEWETDESRVIEIGHVRLCAFAHDAPIAVIATNDTRTAYDLQSGAVLWTRPSSREVSAIALSANGETLATSEILPGAPGSRRSRVELFSVTTGERLPLDLPNSGECIALEFSKSGGRLLSRCHGSIDVYDCRSGQRVVGVSRAGIPLTLSAHVFISEEEWLVFDKNGDAVRLNHRRNQSSRLPMARSSPVRSISFSPTGDQLVVGRDVPRFGFPSSTRLPLLGVDVKNHVAARAMTGDAIRGFRLSDRSRVAVLPNTPCSVAHDQVAWSPTGDLLATSGMDGRLRFWSAETSEMLAERFVSDRAREYAPTAETLHHGWGDPDYDSEGERVVAIDFSRDGERFLSAGRYGSLTVWDTRAISELKRLRLPEASVSMVVAALSPDGTMAACAIEGVATVYHVDSGSVLAEIGERGGPSFRSALFLSDSTGIVLGRQNGIVEIHSLWNNRRPMILEGNAHPVVCLAATSDATILAIGASDEVRLWSLESGSELGNIAFGLVRELGDITSLRFSPDDLTLAGGFTNGAVLLWSAPYAMAHHGR